MRRDTVTLEEVAQKAMVEKGFIIEFPRAVVDEVLAMKSPAQPSSDSTVRDLRSLMFFSIDNDDSRDLDQLTYAEAGVNDNDKIYISVADVDALVKAGSATDQNAFHNTTSVYTPTVVFPMLPLKLSTDLTSLNESQDRLSVVIEVNVDSAGQFTLAGIYPALVHNHAQLAYNGVAAFLEQGTPIAHPISKKPEFIEQIKLQDAIAQRIKKYRYRNGALSFGTIEVKPVIKGEAVVDLEETVHNRANGLIENFMIAANSVATQYLMSKNLPTLRRIVRTPKRWDRIIELAKNLQFTLPAEPDPKALRNFLEIQRKTDPENFPDLSLAIIKLIGRGEYVVGLPGKEALGHFDLALSDYAHTTAPNRRYPDLIMQRLLKSTFYKSNVAYTSEQLDTIAQQCTTKEDDATKVERRVRKSAAAMVLSTQIGRQFQGIVTGAGEKGTWVRIFKPPLEGKLVKGIQGVDVGDRISVKLVHVDVAQGYIDFVRV